jgi:hypothetical protein
VTFNQDCTATCVEVGMQRMAVGLEDGAIALWDIADPGSALVLAPPRSSFPTKKERKKT